jgi:hypothetical protein
MKFEIGGWMRGIDWSFGGGLRPGGALMEEVE